MLGGGLSLAAGAKLFANRDAFDLELAAAQSEEKPLTLQLLNLLIAIEHAEGRVGDGAVRWYRILESYAILDLPNVPDRVGLRRRLFRLLSEGQLTRTNAEWYRLSEKGRASLAEGRRRGRIRR